MNELLKKELIQLCKKEGKSSLIPALQMVQRDLGYLSKESIQFVAETLNMPVSEIYGVATFYNQFRLNPVGKHVIKVCRGTACHVKGSGQLLSLIENELGLKVGETTRDKIFSLEAVACLGACSIAPVIMIDDKFFGHLAAEDIPKVLNQYR
ncbi:MAG: NADH dehydrogenase [Spirochaetes bacterium GWB1_36_13]|nr:MAG: NADH dehydrogenase [Spirochaetes bacterium GWB1_36_13]